MPSGKNFIASIGVIATCVAIFYYIDSQDEDLDTTTLVEACYAANVHEADCVGFEEAGITWDFKQPCQYHFKADQYYYTPRMIFEAAKVGNTTYNQALQQVYEESCGNIKSDLDWEAYKNREYHGRSIKRNLFVPVAIIVALIISGAAYTLSNYKACSTKLGLTAYPGGTFDNIPDDAQCAEDHMEPSKCKKNHSSGPGGWWYQYSRSSSYHLNNGCVEHDNCLWNNRCQDGTYLYGSSPASSRNDCDGDLADAAKSCVDSNPWWNACNDSNYFSQVVKGVMAECPNCDLGYTPAYASGTSYCPTSVGCGRVLRVLVDGVWERRSLGGGC